uniref:DUF4283 domain-containing protein n=1 Tax=Chenopodium quinoa TaxID=63459 RepID=A0A803L3E1_CHEQI
MEDELIKQWEKFQLTKEEETVVGDDFSNGDDVDVKVQLDLSLVGKLWTIKPFNIEAMKKTLMNVWRLRDNIAIRMVETNLFVFQIFNEDDKRRVMEGRPWFFYDKILILKEMCGDEQPSEVQFTHPPMWIRLRDVPFNKCSTAIMKEIGEFQGGFLDFDDSDPIGWGECMRIKILVDINKLLQRGMRLATGQNSSRWIDIQYEPLADFCVFCGMLDHTDREWQQKERTKDEEEVVYQYGPWLRASPWKQTCGPSMLREKEAKWMSDLKMNKGSRTPLYSDPNVIKLRPPGVAQKILFSAQSPTSNDSIPRVRESQLVPMMNKSNTGLVLRAKGVTEGVENEGMGESNEGVVGKGNNEGEKGIILPLNDNGREDIVMGGGNKEIFSDSLDDRCLESRGIAHTLTRRCPTKLKKWTKKIENNSKSDRMMPMETDIPDGSGGGKEIWE